MATDIYSMLTGGYDPRAEQMKQQQFFQQQLGQSTTPQSFIATVGSNMGNMLGQGVSSALEGPSKQQKIQRILQSVGNISDPLGQAKEAYKLLQQEGLVQEAQKVLQRIQELQKERDVQERSLEKKIAQVQFRDQISNSPLQSSEDLLKATQAAFAAGNDSAGAQLLNSYRASLKGNTTKAPQGRSYNKGSETIYETWDPKQGKYVEYSRAPRSIASSDKKDREYYKGQEVIYESWDPKQNKYVEYARAPRTAAGQPTNDQQNLEFQAKTVLNCNLSDPECYKKALENVVAIKRAEPGAGKILSGTVEKLNESRETAVTVRKRISALDRASGILDGKLGAKPIVGAAAGLRLGIDKFASLFGISNGSAAAVTELLQQNRIADAAALLATGAFGAGTGISDRDLQSAFSIVGADMAVTADGLRMVFAQLRKEGLRDLKQYQQDVEGYDDEVFKVARKKKSFYLIDIPKVVEKAEGPKVTASKPLNEMTDAELRALQNQSKN
jgi:hypothetical protein